MNRFVEAQDAGGTYATALAELRRGRKTSHWMWFVFPQVEGLGRSEMAQRYAVSGLAEARAYLADPVLGQRLRECAEVLLELDEPDAVAVFGSVDAMKLRSSMTLLSCAAEVELDRALFDGVLEKWFDGEPDPATLELL
ncbi:calpastatin [Knoellia flava TL1]|uniref:Calpastatin n=1 Tax=Knoellia flava TL1 TaxID=1385518 RepID=A0ABR4XIK0_9MICO|nr:calpastatin [Knoellia flava TL1]